MINRYFLLMLTSIFLSSIGFAQILRVTSTEGNNNQTIRINDYINLRTDFDSDLKIDTNNFKFSFIDYGGYIKEINADGIIMEVMFQNFVNQNVMLSFEQGIDYRNSSLHDRTIGIDYESVYIIRKNSRVAKTLVWLIPVGFLGIVSSPLLGVSTEDLSFSTIRFLSVFGISSAVMTIGIVINFRSKNSFMLKDPGFRITGERVKNAVMAVK